MTDQNHPLGVAQTSQVPSNDQIEALAKDFVARWHGDDWHLLDGGDRAEFMIDAHRWLKCWFALAAQPPAAPVETRPCGSADTCVCEIAGKTTCQTSWRPIDTAPKDETKILLRDAVDKTTVVGFWSRGENSEEACWRVCWDHSAFGPYYEPELWAPIPDSVCRSSAVTSGQEG